MYIVEIPSVDDYPRMLEVWEASVRATHQFVMEEKIRLLKNMIVEQRLFEKSDLFCLRDAEGRVSSFAGTSGNSLDMLFLHPDIIGTGAGKILMSYALGTKQVTRVDVNEQNTNALNFYRRFGFEVIGRSETDDNGQPFPLLHMQLNSSPGNVLIDLPEPVLVRRAEAADLEELIVISKQTYFETFYEDFNGPAAFNAYTNEIFSAGRLQVELADPDSAFYFAIYQQQIAGYYKINYNTAQTLFQGHHSAEIERIYVKAAFQRQQIGKMLLHNSIVTAKRKGTEQIWLAVWEHNNKAIAFYESNGLTFFDRHNYSVAGDPQTDRLMRIDLKKPNR